ncbi:hypothetical protein EfmGK961_11310 [Enterococcus faecium]|nr:hypothetical protein EfmGK961_11310 [Enterococcus faecium]
MLLPLLDLRIGTLKAQLAKSTYYYWVKKLDKPDKYSKIKQEITAIVKESRNSYGYRRVTLALKMKGYTINHKTVRKLMSQMGLTCQIRIKRYKSYKGTVGKIAKNVLKRNFSVDTPIYLKIMGSIMKDH